jgi:hypothetical protein
MPDHPATPAAPLNRTVAQSRFRRGRNRVPPIVIVHGVGRDQAPKAGFHHRRQVAFDSISRRHRSPHGRSQGQDFHFPAVELLKDQ